MKKKVLKMSYSAVFDLEISGGAIEDPLKISFIAVSEALGEALEGMMDGSDTIHDYVSDALPGDIELNKVKLGKVHLVSMRSPDGE